MDMSGLGRPDTPITMTRVDTEDDAGRLGFVGSPSIRVDGQEAIPPPPGEPTGLTCRVYRLANGRYSPTPDPAELRAGLERLIGAAAPAPRWRPVTRAHE